jgi:hypothetical protein
LIFGHWLDTECTSLDQWHSFAIVRHILPHYFLFERIRVIDKYFMIQQKNCQNPICSKLFINSQTPTFGGRNKGNGRKSRGLPLY